MLITGDAQCHRLLFKEAEDEQKKMGINSALHIIIFDELDAICRQRGTLSGSTGVHDTVVNQLLAKVSISIRPNVLQQNQTPIQTTMYYGPA